MKIKSAADKLAAARADAERLAKEIERKENARREAIIAGDKKKSASVDWLLLELRLAHRCALDAIARLEPVAEVERRELLPHELPAAREKLDHLIRRQAALRGVRVVDRSAAQDMELDVLGPQIGALQQHIALLERVAA